MSHCRGVRGPLFLLCGVLGVACTCGPEGGGGCELAFVPDDGSAAYGGYAGHGYGGFGGYGGVGGPPIEAGDAPYVDPCPPLRGVELRWNGSFCEQVGCLAAFEDCNQDALDGCETAIGGNSQNCGACGHACSSAACFWGSCFELTQIAGVAPGEVTALFMQAGTLFFIVHRPEIGAMELRSVMPGGAEESLAHPALTDRTPRLAYTNGRLLMLDRTERRLGSYHSTFGLKHEAGALPGEPEALAAFGGWAFVALTSESPADASADASADADAELDAAGDAGLDAEAGAAWPAAEGSVVRISVGGGTQDVVLAAQGRARSLAVDDGSATLFAGFAQPGRLFALDMISLDATPVASGDFDPVALAVDAPYVYLADASGHRIQRVQLAGGSVETVVTTPLAPFDLRIDAGELWLTTGEPGRLYGVSGSSVELLTGMLRRSTPIAVDSSYVYWSAPKIGILGLAR